VRSAALLPAKSAVVANMGGRIQVICRFFCLTETQLQHHSNAVEPIACLR